MMKIFTILMLLVITNFAKAQQNCLPDYSVLVKRMPLNDSIQIAYIEKGKGPTILFIHGLGGNLSHWQNNIDTLSAMFRCIAIDLPGYGASADSNSKFGKDILNEYADYILAFIKKLKLKKITLVGHSMGGQIATIAALKSSEKIEQLVLVAPAGFETFSEKESEFLSKLSTPVFFKNQDETTIRTNFKNNFYQLPPAAEKLIAYRIAIKQCPGFDAYCNSIVNGINGMLSHPVKSQLNRLIQKVLIVFGDDDALIPNRYLHPKLTILSVATEGASLIKNHSLIMLPKTGHLLQFEQPEIFNSTLINFLKNKYLNQ